MNQDARKARHLKVFARSAFLSGLQNFPNFGKLLPLKKTGEVLPDGKTAMSSTVLRSVREGFLQHLNKSPTHQIISPSHKLFVRYSAVVAVVFLIGSFTPSGAYFEYGDIGAAWDTVAAESTFITDQEGYLTKTNAQTNIGDRSSVNDYLVHNVASGETISTIAQEYNLKTNTILWANDISNPDSLRVQQKLVIPPTDGIYYQVQKGETIEKITKIYGVSSDALVKQNSLVATTGLTVGDDIFIPGAKPLNVDLPGATRGRDTPARIATASRINSIGIAPGGAILKNTNDVPATGKSFIFPTRGKITQYFRKGHPAFDIADRSRPAVWATAGGTVIKAAGGCGPRTSGCNGGYGNYLMIDHGNGLQTLYAHLEYSSVKIGQQVTQGEVIGKMGNTGRVHGVTGIHLHFEIHKNGIRVNAKNYL